MEARWYPAHPTPPLVHPTPAAATLPAGFVAVSLGPDSMLLEVMGLDSDAPLFRLDVPRRRHARWPEA